MQNSLDLLRTTRSHYLNYLNQLDLHALSKIPSGYNNSIFWNIAHSVVTQQLLCYKLSSLEMYVSEEYVLAYKKGSKPNQRISKNDVDYLKELLVSTADKLENDLKAGRFVSYVPYATSFGSKLENITDAISFNLVHESLHLGYCMALKRSI
ncbi:MAG: DinB family protein [Flavobacteriaceae bacterium]|nr:MAG: DinB family protein [Flavobacteriaceae bacterium]